MFLPVDEPLVLFGEGPLQRSLTEFTAHYHLERNHQGKDNQLAGVY